MSDFSSALWLKVRDLLPASRSTKPLKALVCLYFLFVVGLTAGAQLIPDFTETAFDSALLITSPLWLLWALIPFFGGGGGDIDAVSRLAPYPVSPRVYLYSTWVSSFLDFPYLLAFPALVATTFALGGFPAVLLALCFMLGSSALGQMGAWAAGALGRKGRGESLGVMLTTILGIGLLSLTPLSLGVVFTYLPPGWFINALEALNTSDPIVFLWAFLLVLPVPVALIFTPPLVRRAVERRAQGASARTRSWGKPSRNYPPFVSLVSSMLSSTWRALATKALLISVLAIPFLASLAFGSDMVSASSLVFFVAFASAATVSVNVWAFEASGVQLWLSAPVTARMLLWARLTASFLTLLFIEIAVLGVFAVLSGFKVPDLFAALLYSAFASSVCSLVGLRLSTTRPASVDFDSLRARPTTFPSALLFMLLTVVTGVFLASLMVFLGPIVALVALAAVTFLTVETLKPRVRDGATLSSALK